MMILDFYVDEPACFGVPPYLSPYCRYTAGALVAGGIPAEKIRYLTVDQWRSQNKELDDEPELLIVIAGHTVPGKYLGGKIGSATEVLELLRYRQKYHKGGITLVGGPIRYVDGAIRQNIQSCGGLLVRGDIELYAYRLAQAGHGRHTLVEELRARGGLLGARRNYDQINRWALDGAFLSNLHPNFPHLILELESYRGCTRDIFCSFCTEAFYGKPDFRSLAGILKEVRELYTMGNLFFRLGRQADLMTYLPDMHDFQNSFPRPVPRNIARLYSGIRKAAPKLEVLHLDNINPGLIATFPQESREIIRIISNYNTPGDTAAMGMETVDPHVIAINDLKCNESQAERAIEIINEFGAQRQDGIPTLLPGINLLHGLPGENEDTFEKNYLFLKRVMERGLLLRRINIRRVRTYAKTKLEELQKQKTYVKSSSRRKQSPSILEQKFLYWSRRIREEIDRPMLLLNFPTGICIHHLLLEASNQGYLFGRPLGSYPVTVKIPLGDLQAKAIWQDQKEKGTRRTLTIIVTGALERSLIGLSHPIAIRCLSKKALEVIPGLGKRRATRVFLEQPNSFVQLSRLMEGVPFGRESDYDFDIAAK